MTTNNIEEKTFTVETLLKSTYLLNDDEITLRLIELKSGGASSCGYAICAESSSENVMCSLGCSRRRNRIIFNMLSYGQISPCNLRDAVEDLTA